MSKLRRTMPFLLPSDVVGKLQLATMQHRENMSSPSPHIPEPKQFSNMSKSADSPTKPPIRESKPEFACGPANLCRALVVAMQPPL